MPHPVAGRNDITKAIAVDILTGRYKPGELLPSELDLGVKLGVGRNSVREAIKVLSSKGFVVTRTKLGSRIRERVNWSMLDPEVMVWRMALEPRRGFHPQPVRRPTDHRAGRGGARGRSAPRPRNCRP